MTFTKIAKSDDISSSEGSAFEVEGVKVAVFRKDGKLCALADACPHQGGPLSEGSVKDGKVTCPWHRWSFDLTTGECEAKPDQPATVIEVKEEDGEVFVKIEPPVPAAAVTDTGTEPVAPEPREVKPGAGFGYLAKNRPDVTKHLFGFLGKSGANLEPKAKYLIYIALQTSNFSPRGLKQYIPKAIKFGASEGEVLDAILQAYPYCGVGSVVDAIDIFLGLGYGGDLPAPR